MWLAGCGRPAERHPGPRAVGGSELSGRAVEAASEARFGDLSRVALDAVTPTVPVVGMGEQDVSQSLDERQLRSFMKSLLRDVHALERMIDSGMIESGIRRIGAEQEMFLVDQNCRPAPLAVEVLDLLRHPQFTSELARFNLEANLSPYTFGDDCLSAMEAELRGLLDRARTAAESAGAGLLLTGILPTLRQRDLGLDNMMPNPRYLALNHAMTQLRGGVFQFGIKGIDELNTTHPNVMLEACNTSFQVHFQVGADEFAKLYNTGAVRLTAPVLAAATNSPVLLGRRLWERDAGGAVPAVGRFAELRPLHQLRGCDARGSTSATRWVRDSVLEIFREDIARFRVVLASNIDEDPDVGARSRRRANRQR